MYYILHIPTGLPLQTARVLYRASTKSSYGLTYVGLCSDPCFTEFPRMYTTAFKFFARLKLNKIFAGKYRADTDIFYMRDENKIEFEIVKLEK